MLKLNRYIVNLCLILALGACVSNYDTRGYVPEEDKIAQIKMGVTTKQEVADILGYPLAVPAFDDEKWVYVESLFERKAFFSPKELESKVLEITFNSKSRVENLKLYALDQDQKIIFSSDTTPTYGHSVNPVQQMLGNIGKFNKKQ